MGSTFLYTKVQLALLYWKLRKEHVEGSMNWLENINQIPGLADYRQALLMKVNDVKDAANNFVTLFHKELDSFGKPSNVR